MKINWDKIIDSVQVMMIFILIIVVAVCIIALISFDVLTGAGVMIYLTNGQIAVSFAISLATSGLLMALMFISYTNLTGGNKAKLGIGWVVMLGAVAVWGLDVYFDALTADYLRFGQIVSLKTLPANDIQILFRALMGGISTVGETLAVAIILGMPVLKKIIADSLPKYQQQQSKPYAQNPQQKPTTYVRSDYQPKHKPKSQQRHQPELQYHPTDFNRTKANFEQMLSDTLRDDGVG